MDLLLKLSDLYPWSPIERFGAKRYSKRMNGPFHSYLSNSPCPSKNWINSNMDVWFKENVKSCFVHGFRDHPFLVDQRSDSKPLYYSTVFCFLCTRAIIFITTTVLSFYLWLLHRIDLELGNERRESEHSYEYEDWGCHTMRSMRRNIDGTWVNGVLEQGDNEDRGEDCVCCNKNEQLSS